MGWWTQNKQGRSFAHNEDGPQMLWGDGPADLIDHAIDEIVTGFREEQGRPPTKDEVRAGLEFSLSIWEDDAVGIRPPVESDA